MYKQSNMKERKNYLLFSLYKEKRREEERKQAEREKGEMNFQINEL